MNQELINYIKENRGKGFSDEQIRKALIDAGWKEGDVDKGIRTTMEVESGDKKRKLRKNLVTGAIVGLILAGITMSPLNLGFMLVGFPNFNWPFYILILPFQLLIPKIDLMQIINRCVNYGDDCVFNYQIYFAISYFVISVLLGFFITKKRVLKGIIYSVLSFLGIFLIVFGIAFFIINPILDKSNFNKAKDFIDNIDQEIERVVLEEKGYYSKITIPDPPPMSNDGPNKSDNWHIFRIYTYLDYKNKVLEFLTEPSFSPVWLLRGKSEKDNLSYKKDHSDDLNFTLDYSSKYDIEEDQNGIQICSSYQDYCYLLIKNLGKSSEGKTKLLLTMSVIGDFISGADFENTYRNEKLGFELKYPEDWTAVEPLAERPEYGEPYDKIVYFSPKSIAEDIANNDLHRSPRDNVMIVFVEDNPNNLSGMDWCKERHEYYCSGEVMVADGTGYLLEDTTTGGISDYISGPDKRVVYISRNKKMYILGVVAGSPYVEIFNQVVSTFKTF